MKREFQQTLAQQYRICSLLVCYGSDAHSNSREEYEIDRFFVNLEHGVNLGEGAFGLVYQG